MHHVTSAALSLVIYLLSLPCSGYLGISLCACEWEWFISIPAGIGSQKGFKAVLAQTIHKTSSSTPTWHECVEFWNWTTKFSSLSFMFIFCPAVPKEKWAKDAKAGSVLGGCSLCEGEGLAQQRPGLWTCCLFVVVWLQLQCGKIIWKSNFDLERARKHLVVQKHGECFLLCQFVSTHPCLLLSPVRWKQWWIHVDPRMTLHFLQGNCCSVCEKEHRQLFQEHFSSPLLKCCRVRFCCKQQEPFSSWISFQYTLLMQVIQPAVWNLEYPFCHYWQPIAQVRLS